MTNVKRWPLGLSVILILLYLVFPVIVVVGVSFNGSSALLFPPKNLSLIWYRGIFTSSDWVDSCVVTLRVATLTAALSIALGVPAAFALARYRFPAKKLINGVMLSALVAPPIIRAISTYLFYVPLGLNDTITGLAIAHSIGGIPFVIINVVASLRGFDAALERAAVIHGAHPLRAIINVTLPVIAPGIVIGGVFAFMQSAQELIVSIFVMSTARMPLAVKLWEGVRVVIDPTIAAASALLVALAIVGFGCVLIVKSWGERRTAPTQA
jgi:putative spermidine/putrescine transport system permease protein